MIASILLFADFLLLGLVFFFYFRKSLRERRHLQEQANQSVELRQRIYQIQVLQEIGERIGYSLDTSKVVEIVTSSIGSLLEYDTASYLLFTDADNVIFKCHVHNTVSHQFVEEIKGQMLRSVAAICNQELNVEKMDERITGTILDNHLKTQPESYVNIPVIISGQLLAVINVASSQKYFYGHDEAAVLYSIINQAATAVTKLEEVLENERGKLSAILYSMTDGVLMVDLRNQLQVYNPAVVDLLQLPVGREITMFDILNALAGRVDLRTKIEEAIEKQLPITIPEVFLLDKALELTITPVRDHQGEKRGASVILHDVTSEKSLEKLRQEFTAMMVHELRAPLTAVRWSSESLLKNLAAAAQVPPQKIRDSITTIDTAAVNMLELVNDLLDVAKIEAGKFDLNEQEYDLVEIIQQQVKTFEAQADIKHLAMAVIAPPQCRLKFDRVRISQVVDNLISNAIKYTDSGRIDLNISVEPDQNRVVVSIKDTGIGVSRDDLNQLFSKFKQLTSGDRSRKGTGLGLVVSKGIIEAHGGRIWAESAGENLGSTFYFSLPLKK
jgi:signal transduction histidine kinase